MQERRSVAKAKHTDLKHLLQLAPICVHEKKKKVKENTSGFTHIYAPTRTLDLV